jgi:nuclear protein localization family protein 4
MEGYQVSAQCMALVRDNCLLPTKDAPELGYVRESTDKQYVPDVFYKVSQRIENATRIFFRFSSFISFFLLLRSITSCEGWVRG